MNTFSNSNSDSNKHTYTAWVTARIWNMAFFKTLKFRIKRPKELSI